MADKTLIVHNFHPAEPDMIARPERVHIIALARADILQFADKSRFREAEVAGAGYLHIACISLKNMDAMTRPFGDGGVICEFDGTRGGGLSMRREDQFE